MSFKETKFWQWWSIYGKHIEAFAIIFLFIILIVVYTNNSKLQKEVSVNCGWSGEDYKCYCEKSQALEIKNKLENENSNFGDLYVPMDR
jgi:hypothetical protein